MLLLEEAFSVEPIFDLAKRQEQRLLREVNQMTEAWMRKAIEAGPGVNLARSGPHTKEGGWTVVYEFQLIAPGTEPQIRAPAIIFTQPELTDGERVRLLAGRHDWREDSWEDECGVSDCDHDCCAVYWGRKAPTRL